MWTSFFGLVLVTYGLFFEVVASLATAKSKDFHTFREVKVRLKNPESLQKNEVLRETSLLQGGQLHLSSLRVQILEANAPADEELLFDVDLLLNHHLLPQNYFQKYHQKVSKLSAEKI